MISFSVVTGLLIIVTISMFTRFYKRWKQRRQSNKETPGLESTDSSGNLSEVKACGSMTQFLNKLHMVYGPVVHFWINDTKVVSTYGKEAFKDQIHLFDRPPVLFAQLEPFIGVDSIQYQNGPQGRNIRNKLDSYLDYTSCASYLPLFIQEAENTVLSWQERKGIKVRSEMLQLALHSLTVSCFGDFYTDKSNCDKLLRNYDACFLYLEQKGLQGKEFDQETETNFQEGIKELKEQTMELMDWRRIGGGKLEGGRLLIDEIMQLSDSVDFVYSQLITYVTAGFHTTGTLMTWLLYYLAKHEDCQTKVRQEIVDVLGKTNLYPDAIKELIFTRACTDEALRCSELAPFAGRVCPDKDITIHGYNIPKNTPIIQSMGTVYVDPKLWNDPKSFNPHHFDDVKLDSVSCPFFGFAGKRKCPAYRFSYFETAAFLSVILRAYKLTIDSQAPDPGKMYGFMTHPQHEIYLNLTPI